MITAYAFAALGLVFLALLAIYLRGPRVEIAANLQPVNLPPNLEKYLADSEADFDDIIPGTEKTIIWAGEPGTKTPISIIYLHGFSASRQETAPLSEIVAMKLGANLFYTRFTGHGRNGEAMLEGSVEAWLNDAQEALAIGQRLGEKVIVIGVSTGGTVATWLATQPMAKSVAAIVLISPNFAPADRRSKLLLWPWGGRIAEFIVGKEYIWESSNARHEKYWTHRFPTRALLPMMGLVSVAKSLDLGLIDQPALVIYSPADSVVSATAIEAFFGRFGSRKKRLVSYSGAGNPEQHVLAGDILSPSSTEELAKMIVDFAHD